MAADREIQNLIDLVSNTTEAFSTVLFLTKPGEDVLHLAAYQSLSQNIDEDVLIGPGEGLIGWVHKNNQPVNLDQFDRDTRNLLFYRSVEAIKSFMAVPLPQVHGVLAVDSKQRYVFTEKSHKALQQFGLALELTLLRSAQTPLTELLSRSVAFLKDLETNLNSAAHGPEGLIPLAELVRRYTPAKACFLTSMMHTDPDHYLILVQDIEQEMRLQKDIWPLGEGLAGWIMLKGQPLILDRVNLGSEKSFIFHPEEPIKHFKSFAGYPLSKAGRVRGAMLLMGEDSLSLEQTVTQTLETAASRLGAHLDSEILFERVGELGRLDSQVGLPHRTYFTKRLSRMIKMASVRSVALHLLLIKIANLDQVTVQVGQEAVQEVLRAVARHLLATTKPEHELGHISYGLFALAATGPDRAEMKKAGADLATRMTDWPLSAAEGRVKLKTLTAAADFPADASRAEDLIQAAINRLQAQALLPTGRG